MEETKASAPFDDDATAAGDAPEEEVVKFGDTTIAVRAARGRAAINDGQAHLSFS